MNNLCRGGEERERKIELSVQDINQQIRALQS